MRLNSPVAPMTFFCYTDESGTPEVPGTSSHFALVGFTIPIQRWREADRLLTEILAKYELGDAEIHTAWLLRPYPEQRKVRAFDSLSYAERRSSVSRLRAGELLRLRKLKNKSYKQAKKNYAHTDAYIHLGEHERRKLVGELVECIRSWEWATIFAEVIDKLHFDEAKTGRSVSEQAFEQLVSRFEQFLNRQCTDSEQYGVLVHDNNQTVAQKHTGMMRDFHKQGTLWSQINRISETPLFVDSKLTRMVQIADLCSYILRRYVENQEDQYIDLILDRADWIRNTVNDKEDNVAVGIRHYTKMLCKCKVCAAHAPRRVQRLASLQQRHPNGLRAARVAAERDT